VYSYRLWAKSKSVRSHSFAAGAGRLAANEYSVLTRDVMSRLPQSAYVGISL